LSLLVFDIDRFKSINDTHGHHAGDLAIQHVCAICNEAKRTSDIFARLGGDEFALLLPETDSAQATILAERLRQSVARQPVTVDGMKISMSLSIGLAPATLSQSGVAALMKSADEALYTAKRRGRNCVALAEQRPPPNYKLAAE
jgi:diguanylate cyclase (GGDEF)-like protein